MRTNDLTIDFISCTQLVQDKPAEIGFINVTVETIIPANINFFGASVEPCEDAILFYQIN